MRWSNFFLFTSKEEPSDAVSPSHRLLLRAGFISQVSSGIYEILPAGFKVLKKVEKVIREEMERIGCQELLLTVLNPKELWEETGRWEAYGKELFKLKDRNGREFCLGPTHEEEITDLFRKFVRSYRSLPLYLYQVQVKFRDEKRPRFGLIRAREFIMKDAYSFDRDEGEALKSYKTFKEAYERIFKRLGLETYCVEASVGQIGGKFSNEFIAPTPFGEAHFVLCKSCGYTANSEIVPLKRGELEGEEEKPLKLVETPNTRTIKELSQFLGVKEEKILKALLYIHKGEPYLILIRGDREVDEKKVEAFFGDEDFHLASEEEVREILNTEKGFVGIFNLPKNVKVVWDNSTYGKKNLVVALNKVGYHYINVNPGRDFNYGQFADLCKVEEGDPCPKCGKPLQLKRGLELGHIFLLGDRYSKAMGALISDERGKEVPVYMGCYGIGVSRILSALVEQNYDERGIRWNYKVNPFEVLIICLNVRDEELLKSSLRIYQRLKEEGFDVLFDDRDERAGFKFKDADLVGIPLRVVLGKKYKEKKLLEVQDRYRDRSYEVKEENLVKFLRDVLKS